MNMHTAKQKKRKGAKPIFEINPVKMVGKTSPEILLEWNRWQQKYRMSVDEFIHKQTREKWVE